MGNNRIKILCYADDAVIIGENEDDLQRMVHEFSKTAETYNMKISIEKTKSMVIARDPTRCKIIIEEKCIEQVIRFEYLGVEISSYGDLREGVRKQANKAARVSGCLRDVVWRNNNASLVSKVRIYKTCVRPLLTYAVEARADTAETKRILRTTEMKTLRSITGNTLRDRIRNNEIRETCTVQDVVRWSRQRRREWNQHVNRMSGVRITKAARDGNPPGRRPVGRPPKKWKDSWQSTSQENALQ